MTLSRKAQTQKEQVRLKAIDMLRGDFENEDKTLRYRYVHLALKHVSRSGMRRIICPIVSADRDDIWRIGYEVSIALDWRYDYTHNGVAVDGCGMDMGFHLVYTLSRALWPNGYSCDGDRCTSNDHVNDRDCTRDGSAWHKDGGYRLTQCWI